MSAPQGQGTDVEKNIEIWKVKKLVKRLEAAYVAFPVLRPTEFIVPPKLLALTLSFQPRKRHQHDFTHHPTQGSDFSRRKDVG
jgi:hypothetical protein